MAESCSDKKALTGTKVNIGFQLHLSKLENKFKILGKKSNIDCNPSLKAYPMRRTTEEDGQA